MALPYSDQTTQLFNRQSRVVYLLEVLWDAHSLCVLRCRDTECDGHYHIAQMAHSTPDPLVSQREPHAIIATILH